MDDDDDDDDEFDVLGGDDGPCSAYNLVHSRHW